MRRTEALQGARIAMFLNILHRWESAELNQAEGAELLGVGERTFRRCRDRYEEEGEAGLMAPSQGPRPEPCEEIWRLVPAPPMTESTLSGHTASADVYRRA